MALAALTTWEIRTTGNANNGGGFNNRIPGTSVDYSQQNASQLSKADLACAAGAVTVTSATLGFTNAMVGNLMRIRAGNNFTVGFYEIVQFNGVGSVDLDRVPVTAVGSNGVAEVGGAQIQLSAVVVSALVAGNTIYIQNGVYAAHPAVSITAGTPTLAIKIYGYNAARGDSPTGNNRPVLQMGANIFTIVTTAICLIGKHFRLEGSGHNIALTNSFIGITLENVKITNTAAAGTVELITTPAQEVSVNLLDCELSGTAGATSIATDINRLFTAMNCFFHDLTYGVVIGNSNEPFANLTFNIFARIGQSAISQGGANAVDLNCVNNTFANCGRSGIYLINTITPFIINNSFTDCVVAGIEIPNTPYIAKNNNFFSCGVAAITHALYPLRICDNNIYVNPQFFTPGTLFSEQRTSGLIDTGFSNELGV